MLTMRGAYLQCKLLLNHCADNTAEAMDNQLKLMVGVSGALLGLIVGVGIGLIVNIGGDETPIQPAGISVNVTTTSVPRVITTDAPIAVAP